jgi:CubicO group peptidase (beta-lactamase class C family)
MLLYTDQMAITIPLGHLPIARPTCAAEPTAGPAGREVSAPVCSGSSSRARRQRATWFSCVCLALGVATPVLDAQRRQVATEPWDGPDTAPWNTADATASGLDPTKLDQAARLAETTDADSLVVVRHGRIVFEQYWNERGPDDVQQMYSATKSPFAFLVGRAVARGDITSIDQPLIDFVPELAGHRREVLTFRNVMAMESGLTHSTELDQGDTRAGRSQLEAALARGTTHGPDEYFIYNHAAYRLLFTALERATGLSLPDLTRAELFAPLGMRGAYWVEIRTNDRLLGYQSIRMQPRDLAKVGQLMLNDGLWNGTRYLPAEYVAQLRTAPVPKANPSYGLFWHLNAGDFYLSYRESDFVRRRLLPGTPPDAYANFGSGGQIVVVIPSLDLVWVRTGRQIPSNIWAPDSTVAQLSAAVVAAATR